MFVIWQSDRILQPLPSAGEPIITNGVPARLRTDGPGGCGAIAADETLTVLVPIGQPTPLSNVAVLVCIRGPNLDEASRQVRLLISSTTVAG